jgi:ribonuclease T2
MQKYWPSLKGPNAAFWAHEWTKHGTCSTLKQLDFFQTTLDARKKYDAYGARFQQKFTPDDDIGSHACSLEALAGV